MNKALAEIDKLTNFESYDVLFFDGIRRCSGKLTGHTDAWKERQFLNLINLKEIKKSTYKKSRPHKKKLGINSL